MINFSLVLLAPKQRKVIKNEGYAWKNRKTVNNLRELTFDLCHFLSYYGIFCSGGGKGINNTINTSSNADSDAKTTPKSAIFAKNDFFWPLTFVYRPKSFFDFFQTGIMWNVIKKPTPWHAYFFEKSIFCGKKSVYSTVLLFELLYYFVQRTTFCTTFFVRR